MILYYYNEVIICDMCDMCDMHDICDKFVICMICIYVISVIRIICMICVIYVICTSCCTLIFVGYLLAMRKAWYKVYSCHNVSRRLCIHQVLPIAKQTLCTTCYLQIKVDNKRYFKMIHGSYCFFAIFNHRDSLKITVIDS